MKLFVNEMHELDAGLAIADTDNKYHESYTGGEQSFRTNMYLRLTSVHCVGISQVQQYSDVLSGVMIQRSLEGMSLG